MKISSFRTYILALPLLLILFPACGGPSENMAAPVMRQGFLDLSTHDFALNGPVYLSGSWEFYWETFLVSGTTGSDPLPRSISINVPSEWLGFRDAGGRRLPREGFATYKAFIKLPENVETLALYVPFIYSSYRAYVADMKGNTLLIGRGGDPGKSSRETRPLFVPLTASFRTSGSLTLIFEVADYSTTYSGIRYTPILGLPDQVFRKHEEKTATDFFVIGCLIIIGLYNMALFLLRRNEKAPLWLGMACIDMALRTYLKGRYLELLIPSSEHFTIILKMSFLAMYTVLPLFLTFMRSAFPRYIPALMIKSIWLFTAILALFIIITPVSMGYRSMIIFHVLLVLFGLFGLSCLVRGSYRDRNSLGLVSLAGMGILFIFAAIDVLEANSFIHVPHITHIGLLIFIFSQAFVVAGQNAGARKKIENLSGELTRKSLDLKMANTSLHDLNVNLESKVNERTAQLEQANDETVAAMAEMESINESLIRANMDIENANRIIKRDMDMAQQVQSRFLPKDPPFAQGWDIAFEYRAMSGVSGDFYDFYTEEETLTGISLFDVSGHGVASALVTMMAKSLVFRIFKAGPGLPLHEVMDIINRELMEEIGSVGNYLTGIILRIHENAIEYVNGAHTHLLLGAGTSRPVSIVQPPDDDIRGKLIGMPTIEDNFTGMTFDIHEGESLLLYSDCLIESVSNDTRYGMDRLQKVFGQCSQDMTAKEQLDFILKDFFAFTGSTSLQDDLTVIVAKKTVSHNPGG